MRKRSLVFGAFSLFFSCLIIYMVPMVSFADCGWDAEDLETRVSPGPGKDHLNRQYYHASFIDADDEIEDAVGWVYLNGNTTYALGTNTYAIELEDEYGSFACAYLGYAVVTEDLDNTNLVTDSSLDDWDGPNPYLDEWVEVGIDGTNITLTEYTIESYDYNGVCAEFEVVNNENNDMFDIYQNFAQSCEDGACYFGKCWYKKVEEDTEAQDPGDNPFIALEIMGRGLGYEYIYDFTPDTSWQEFSGYMCHNQSYGHEVTFPFWNTEEGGKVRVDEFSVYLVEARGIEVSSVAGSSNGNWLSVGNGFSFNHIKYISIYEVP